MEHIINLYTRDLKKSLFRNAQFVFVAETGAMGVLGEVLIITSEGNIFSYNYCAGDVNKLLSAMPALKYYGNTGKAPDGWELIYLGAGHVLLIRQDAYPEFKKMLGEVEHPDDIGPVWRETAWKVIEKQQKRDKLLRMANKAVQNAKQMTAEESIEYDAEYGYDPDEDDTYRSFVKRVQKYYCNQGNAELKYKPCDVWKNGDQINLWTYWQGYQLEDIESGVDILLVGQDWGNPDRQKTVVESIRQIQCGNRKVAYADSTNPTDRMLITLFKEIGFDITKEEPGCRMFFTNYSLGYRSESETGGMTKKLLLEDREYFEELVSIIKPRVIICLGKLVYEAVTGENVKGFVEQLSKGKPLMSMYGDIKVFGVPHCGARGINNVGGYEVMRGIWGKMKEQFR